MILILLVFSIMDYRSSQSWEKNDLLTINEELIIEYRILSTYATVDILGNMKKSIWQGATNSHVLQVLFQG